MSRMWQMLVALFCVAVSSYGIAEVEKKAEKPGKTEIEVGKVLSTSVIQLRRTLLPLATAMPEDKYGFAPTNGEFKGVRTFGEQLKHVAAVNFIFASTILGEKPPAQEGEGEEGPPALKTKAESLKYVGESFDYVLKAVDTIDEKNVVAPINSPFGEGKTTRLAIAILIVGHCNDHYGQMVEYLRWNGIVPPASQS